MRVTKFGQACFWPLPSVVLLAFIGPMQNVVGAEIVAPAISIVAIHSPTWSEDGPRLICRVRVENPNTQPLSVSSADVNLKLAGAPAATGWLAKRVIIPARSASEVNVMVNVIPGAAISWMPMFLGSGDFSVPFEVSGIVTVDRNNLGSIPFHERGVVEMTQGRMQVRPSR